VPSLIVYEKPRCSTCRNLRELLDRHGIAYETVDYHVTGITHEELRGILTKAGAGPRDLLRVREGLVAALGLPGLAGFVGELLIFLGSYPSHRLATSLAVLGTLLVAAATLWTFQRIFFGPIGGTYARVRDLSTLELGTGVGLLCLLVLLGVLPAILMDSINFSVLTLLSRGGG